ncbi:hypothetical protein ACWELP_24980 [Rhodococcus aetherivorans]
MTYSDLNPGWTRDNLAVVEVNGVEMTDYRPWEEDRKADWKAHTYTWKCRCGRTPTLRHERIGEFWKSVQGNPNKSAWKMVVSA